MRETNPRSWIGFLLIGGVLFYAAVLFLLPMLAIVQGAFKDGLTPMIRTLSDPSVQHAFLVTFTLSAGAVVLNTISGLIVAWVLVRHHFRGRRILDALVDIPFVFSPVIAGYALIVLFGRDGWLTPPLFPIVFALPGILLVKTFVSLPFVARELQPVLETLQVGPEEAARTIGASHWMIFRRIIFPEIRVALLYGVVLSFARAVGEFGAIAVVGGSIQGSTETATSFVFRALNDRNNPGAYSVSVILGLVSIVVLVLMSILRRNKVQQG